MNESNREDLFPVPFIACSLSSGLPSISPAGRGGGGFWGWGYSYVKGVGMLVVSLRVFSGQNAIIISCNHWATPRLGGWGWEYSHIKGVGMLVVSLRVFSGQNTIILSCNHWATPRLVSFKGLIQNSRWASPPISYGSPPQRDLSKVGLLLGYPLNWVMSFLQLVIWMGPGHWCPKPRKFGET